MRNSKKKSKLEGKKNRPRVSVVKSNKFIYAQLIDDESYKTLVSGNDRSIKKLSKVKNDLGESTKVQKAFALGVDLAKKAKKKKISTVVFDRGKYRYHGRVKALAEGLREGGLKV